MDVFKLYCKPASLRGDFSNLETVKRGVGYRSKTKYQSTANICICIYRQKRECSIFRYHYTLSGHNTDASVRRKELYRTAMTADDESRYIYIVLINFFYLTGIGYGAHGRQGKSIPS